MPQDIPGDATSTAELLIGVPATSTFEYTGDQDWFQIYLTAGIGYSFQIVGSGDNPAISAGFYLYSAADTINPVVGANPDFSSLYPSIDSYMPTTSGLYWVQAGGAQGQYTLTASPTADTVAGGTLTNATLNVGDTATSAIDTLFDQDWFAIHLDAGQIYEFSVHGVRSYAHPYAQIRDPNLVIYDASGKVYATLDDGNSGSTDFFAQIDQSGTYYVAVSLFNPGYRENTGSYHLTVQNEAASGANTELSLTPGTPTIGAILWEGDTDWYAVQLQAGVTYQFYFPGQIGGADTSSAHINFSAGLHLYDSGAIQIAQDNGVGQAPELYYTPTTSGTFYIEVSGRDPVYDLGYYQIAFGAVNLAGDAIAGNATSTASIAVGGSMNSTLETRADHDWVAVQLTAGHGYYFDAIGAETGVEVGAIVTLRGADGSAISTPTNQFVASTTGVYYLDVSVRQTASDPVAVHHPGGAGGDYTLTINEDVLESINTLDALNVGSTVQSSTFARAYDPEFMVHHLDSDWFRTNLVAGQTYLFLVDAPRTVGGQGVVSLTLMDASGNAISTPFTHDNYLLYQPSASGTYFISASANLFADLTGTGLPIGYSLSLQQLDQSADLYAANMSTTGVLTEGSPISSAIDFASDVDWLSFNVVAGTYYSGIL